jgi:hypothetical protein
MNQKVGNDLLHSPPLRKGDKGGFENLSWPQLNLKK